MKNHLIHYSCFLFLMFAHLIMGTANESTLISRYALIVGSNSGGQARSPLRFAVRDAQIVAAVLRTIGGVDKDNCIVIQNPDREQFLTGLKQLRLILDSKNNTAQVKQIIIYYSGHADHQGILLNQDRIEYQELKSALQQMNADVRIGIVDACASGALTRQKSGIKRPPFLFDASVDMKGHAYLTSSSIDEAAQESEQLQGSFFTHYLVSALRGAADANTDGKVTLDEAYQFAFHETLRQTESTLAGPQHAAYDISLKGSGDLVLTDLRKSSAGLRLEKTSFGTMFIRQKDGTLLVELKKNVGKEMEIGLEPGEYEITLEKPDQLLYTALSLKEGGFHTLTEVDMTVKPQAAHQIRGEEQPSVHSGPLDTIPWSFELLPSFKKSNGKFLRMNTYHNFSLNLIAGHYAQLNGIGIGGVAQWADDEVLGMQIAGVGNVSTGSLKGMQLSGTFNYAQQPIKGIQLTGGANIARAESVTGIQASGGFNYIEGNLHGIQGSGGANIVLGDTTNGIQYSGAANFANGFFKGIQIGGGVNCIRGDAPKTLQVSGGCNIGLKDVKGIQAAGGANICGNSISGVQVSGGANVAQTVAGVQVSGGANIAQVVDGFQVSGGANVAENFSGVQISCVNISNYCKGVQLGLVNISDSNDGTPIGLISIIRSNLPHLQLSIDESGFFYMGMRSGTESIYSILSLGIVNTNSPTLWCYTWGLGARYNTKQNMFYGVELTANGIEKIEFWEREPTDLYAKLRFLFGYKLLPRLSVWLGPTANLYISDTDKSTKLGFKTLSLKKQSHDRWMGVWPGFVMGIEF